MTASTELPGGYAQAAFAARPGATEAFLAAVLARLPKRAGLSILDLGCGTGDVTLALAERCPGARIVGLDISEANVAIARQRIARDLGGRVAFVAADYRTWRNQTPFDAIVSDSVLHLIPGEDAVLATKLSADLAPGGVLIATMPDACMRNGALLLQRRLWRATPKVFDKMALHLAERLHRGEPSGVLADRIGYLRMLPDRVHGAPFVAAMGAAGFAESEATPWPGASILKLRHKLIVWRHSRD